MEHSHLVELHFCYLYTKKKINNIRKHTNTVHVKMHTIACTNIYVGKKMYRIILPAINHAWYMTTCHSFPSTRLHRQVFTFLNILTYWLILASFPSCPVLDSVNPFHSSESNGFIFLTLTALYFFNQSH